MQGEQVKSAPKGFDKEDPNIDLLKFKQYYFMHEFKQADVNAKNFDKEVVKVFQKIRPYFDYMSDILTTDLNGRNSNHDICAIAFPFSVLKNRKELCYKKIFGKSMATLLMI